MASIVLMPKQGNTVESCILLEWNKQEGDIVAEGDILCEAETDKATIEVESTVSGSILKLLWEVEDEVPVQQPIAIIGEPGEDISSLLEDIYQKPKVIEEVATKQEIPELQAQVTAVKNPSLNLCIGSSPRARNLAQQKQLDISSLSGTGPGSRIIERDVLLAAERRGSITPIAAQGALEGDFVIPREGSGIGGRIRLSDLNRQDVDAKELTGISDFPGTSRSREVKGIRKITAERMHKSILETCQLTLTTSADATNLLAFRKRLKESEPEFGMNGVTINDIILFATSWALRQHPTMNAHFLGNKIVEFMHTHLGIAVDTERGLLVPVLQYADLRSLGNLSQEVKRLTAASIEGKAKPEFFEGGTFTVTNLGQFGIEHFTPVLNTPEVGILGVNTITKHPVEQDGDIILQPRISFSLTFDHQAVDGAPAARFLQDLVKAIENIDLIAAR